MLWQELLFRWIDSNSTDNIRDIAIAHGFNVHKIDTAEFNHGGLRNPSQ